MAQEPKHSLQQEAPSECSDSPSTMPPDFPQFSRFPPEIQIMVWKQFIQNEAANRLVLYHIYIGLARKEWERRIRAKIPYPQSLRVMPSKWLVSPLLSVNSQSRAVALEQYPTRLDIFDFPGLPFTYRTTVPHPQNKPTSYSDEELRAYYEAIKDREARNDARIWPCEAAEAWRSCAVPRWKWTYPEMPGWLDRQTMCEQVEREVAWQAQNIMAFEPAEGKAYRGCAYLNLATDRFAEVMPWVGGRWPGGNGWYGRVFQRHDGLEGPKLTYGLRCLSDALTDFQYHETPFDLHEVLDRRRPAPLRFASAGLSDEVLGQIRHLVFADHDQARIPSHPPVLPPCPVFDTRLLGRCCPQALAPENDCLWTYDVNEEMLRSFFDGLEDKGAEHLALRKTKMRKIEIEDDFPDLDDQGNPILPVKVYVVLAVDE